MYFLYTESSLSLSLSRWQHTEFLEVFFKLRFLNQVLFFGDNENVTEFIIDRYVLVRYVLVFITLMFQPLVSSACSLAQAKNSQNSVTMIFDESTAK